MVVGRHGNDPSAMGAPVVAATTPGTVIALDESCELDGLDGTEVASSDLRNSPNTLLVVFRV